jgi:HK97 gp10 family phage protein
VIGMAVQGLAETLRIVDKYQKDVEKGVKRAVQRAALRIQTTARRRIQRGPKTGEWYGRHQASSPGESPAADTGRLSSSIQVDDRGLEASVYTNLEYAEGLEFGTSRIKPRPFLNPSVEEVRPQFMRDMEEATR